MSLQHTDFSSFGYMPSRGTDGSDVSSIFKFFRNLHIIFKKGSANLHSHHHCDRISFSLHSQQSILSFGYLLSFWQQPLVMVCILNDHPIHTYPIYWRLGPKMLTLLGDCGSFGSGAQWKEVSFWGTYPWWVCTGTPDPSPLSLLPSCCEVSSFSPPCTSAMMFCLTTGPKWHSHMIIDRNSKTVS
jgi:hypothetical protein